MVPLKAPPSTLETTLTWLVLTMTWIPLLPRSTRVLAPETPHILPTFSVSGSGEAVWAKRFPGTIGDQYYPAAVGSNGSHIVVAASFMGSIVLGSTTLTAATGYDRNAFVAPLP